MSNLKQLKSSRPAILDNRRVLHLDNHRPLKIEVISGAAYVTREGDDRDYIVKSGENLSIEERGLVVIQGLPFAEYKVCA